MIAGLDSAYPPNAASCAQAYAGGVRLWAGYFAGPNIYNAWSKADFDRVRAGGLATLAYCSGYADPILMKKQSAVWGVPICLDVESGIRGDGSWVQAWLDASGAGIYGNAPVHGGRRAPFHILAAYGGDPGATWTTRLAHPGVPCGWQWQGTHQEFGASVDRGWYDNAFASTFGAGGGSIGGPDLDATEHRWLQELHASLFPESADGPPSRDALNMQLAAILTAIKNMPAATGALSPLQAQALIDIHDIATRIENSLKGA